MIFYPPRKVICTFGVVFAALFLFALYRYGQVHKLAYLCIALLSLCISLYHLMPVVRNQIVEIVSNGIILTTFGRQTLLTPEHMYGIEYRNNCIASYQFKQGSRYYQVTPIAYKHGFEMLLEFQRIFGS